MERHIGDARDTLPAALADRRVGVFVHDSLHTYDHERFELETALAHHDDAIVLISDNSHGVHALPDVCRRRGLRDCPLPGAPTRAPLSRCRHGDRHLPQRVRDRLGDVRDLRVGQVGVKRKGRLFRPGARARSAPAHRSSGAARPRSATSASVTTAPASPRAPRFFVG